MIKTKYNLTKIVLVGTFSFIVTKSFLNCNVQIINNKKTMNQINNRITYTWNEIQGVREDNNKKLLEIEKRLSELEQVQIDATLWKEKKEEILSDYNTQILLNELSDEVKKEERQMGYLEKYFHLEKERLLAAQNFGMPKEWFDISLLGNKCKNITISVGEGLFVLYDKTSEREVAFPKACIIQNPNVDIGFMNARAGMYFSEIKEKAYHKEVQKYTEENFTAYYLEYKDDKFTYYYYSELLDGTNSELYITKKAEIQ